MPLNTKGKKILKAMKEQYGSDAKKVFYASKNKGVIKNVEKKMDGGLSGGKRSGPPPLRGPNPQGLKIKKADMGMFVGFGTDSLLKNSQTARDFTGNLGLGGKALSDYYNKKNKEDEEKELKVTKAYLGKEIKQPTETKKEFGTRHEVHTKLKESEIYRKGSKVSDASPMLKKGGQLKTKKAMGGVFAVKDAFERSQTVRDIGSQLGLAPRFLADKYNKEAQEKKEQLEAAEQKKAMGLKQGGMSCPYRRGGKTSIQGVSKIQVKGQKFTGVK
jgi:hypothetical protein